MWMCERRLHRKQFPLWRITMNARRTKCQWMDVERRQFYRLRTNTHMHPNDKFITLYRCRWVGMGVWPRDGLRNSILNEAEICTTHRLTFHTGEWDAMRFRNREQFSRSEKYLNANKLAQLLRAALLPFCYLVLFAHSTVEFVARGISAYYSMRLSIVPFRIGAPTTRCVPLNKR